MTYNILKLKAGREKSLLNRHPWIFSGAVQIMPEAENGHIIKVVSNKNEFLGYGFFSIKSQITCRVFEFTEIPNDAITPTYWTDKILNAFEMRKGLVASPQTNAYRLLHAEGDFFPGLIIDIYNETAVIQVLIRGTERLISIVLQSLIQIGIKSVYLRNPSTKNIEEISSKSGWIYGIPQKEVEILENGIKFKVDIEQGQKTGFFLDQRDNRDLLRRLSKGKKVLNTFSYTGGFSVYALAGQATEVQCVDISAHAIKTGEDNITLNFPNAPHKSFVADCFDYLRNMEEEYDIIILDPPAFAKNAHSVNQAAKGYKDINLQAIKKVKKGGLIFTFSCSHHIDKDLFRKIIFGAAADAKREVRIIQQLTQPADHPVNIYHPEGEYLKGLVLKVD